MSDSFTLIRAAMSFGTAPNAPIRNASCVWSVTRERRRGGLDRCGRSVKVRAHGGSFHVP
jgi:hypothetical protein